jgi:hypothetical protein
MTHKNNFEWSSVEQNSDEWFNMRAGRLTGSNLSVVMANYGKAFGEPAKKYAIDIALEQITGNPTPQIFTNRAMDIGSELEPVAIMMYEQQTFSTVTKGGFYYSDFIGVSVDGNVCDDGIVEAKVAVSPAAHFHRIASCKIDSAYKWQCIGNLFYTDRQWIDFVSYCPLYPDGKQLFTIRLHRGQFSAEFNQIEKRVQQFKELVAESKEKI